MGGYCVFDTKYELLEFINGELGIDSNAESLTNYICQKAVQYKNTHYGYYPKQINIVAVMDPKIRTVS